MTDNVGRGGASDGTCRTTVGVRAGEYRIEQECIGRYLPERGCNWAAYGLFRGPVIVQDDGIEIAVLDFAGKPFTGKDGAG